MSAHTPGPWKWWTSCSFRRLSHEHDGDVLHAVIQRGDGHPDIHIPNGGWDGPDARLIAAAPEQHAALLPIAMFPLEDFAQYDDCADMRVIFKANDWSLTVGDIRRARAAIAKATGATP